MNGSRHGAVIVGDGETVDRAFPFTDRDPRGR